YAATGKTAGRASEDLRRPEVGDFAQSVENAVVHYGDTTLTPRGTPASMNHAADHLRACANQSTTTITPTLGSVGPSV
ncbi:MAG TPA: hypothetical protein VFI46_06460, partial [Jiangellaceae bacterium]|nr:hypothetical protein [Jiangellaceae bacterium]